MKTQRGIRILGEIVAFPAAEIRVEHEPALVESAHEDHAHGRTTVRIRARQRYRIPFDRFTHPGIIEPGSKLIKWIGR